MIVFVLLILITFITISPVQAEMVLTGEVRKNVESTRQMDITHKPEMPSFEFLKLHLQDKNYNENISMLLQGNVDLKDRILALFSDKSYAVMYKADEYHVWYYSANGNLEYIEVKNTLAYPSTAYKYDLRGNVINMTLRSSKYEAFMYNNSGKLLVHWLKENAYDEMGNIIMKRRYFE